MEILDLVKDLLLDFAKKLAQSKCYGNPEKEKDIVKNDFVTKMLLLRDRYPELLFINYPSDINKEDAKSIFLSIKESVKDVYELDKLVCPQFYPCTLEGCKLEIPGTVESKLIDVNGGDYGGVYNIDYDHDEDKVKCINLTLLHSLMLLPIKKIRLSFVDLKRSYEYELLLRNLPSVLYNEKPVTTDEQMEELLSRLEKRKEEIIRKYGNYGDYCKQNCSIPLPYEIIVLYDESFGERYCDRWVSLIEWCKRIGVLLIFPRKVSLNNCNSWGVDIINPNGKEAYSQKDDDTWWNTGGVKYTGLYLNHDVLTNADPMDPMSDLCPNRSATLIDDILSTKENNNILIGSGEYEVFLDKDKHINDCLFERIPPVIRNAIINTPSHVRIGCFPTEQQACEFIKGICNQHHLPSAVGQAPILSLNTFEYGFLNTKVSLELVVEAETFFQHQEDIDFYFRQFAFPKGTLGRVSGLLKGICQPNENEIVNRFDIYGEGISVSLRYWGKFSSSKEANKYKDQLVFAANEEAVKEWGDYFFFSHVHIYGGSDLAYYGHGLNDLYTYKVVHIRVKKKEHNVIHVEHYEEPKNDGLINFTPVTNNQTLLKACFEYIQEEVEAENEVKLQAMDFNMMASDAYEMELSTIAVPVGVLESGDEKTFHMDLVSHVHSFIIGQSGSGKSVFLHNVIGGAMLKYAPEDLQLYLLDFKLGGVEFNRYKGAKHVKALLVDNSDPQVTLEILKELRSSMAERGKRLRGAGVNNIGEYNKLNAQNRMPHVLVVADECHEMFRDDDSIPRKVRTETSDIVIKIAKEGRSQGVHLVFATQTLSGTDISSEIINNVSDFYLLKCAQTDAERLVPRSSDITSELSTGQIYYHHVDEQVKFQAYYTDKETAEKLMAAVVEKAKDHKSNGEFYFNGAQMFYLDEAVKEQLLSIKGKSPVAFLGKAIDISQKDMYIKLNEDFSENVLLLGLNDQEQVTRTTLNLFVSLMMSARLKHEDIAFKVVDCLNNEEGEVHEQLLDLENAGFCDIIERRQRSKFFKNLAQGVQRGTADETILLILGQDRFRELKMDMELDDGNINKSSDDEQMMNISDDFFGGSSGSTSSTVKTYREALNVILEKGPDFGVHTLLQLEKSTNLLFEDYITSKTIFQRFKHLVMLKSEESTSTRMGLNDEIHLEKLSSDWERLRAYYYAEESDSYTLFTPYMLLKSEEIINLLKSI